MGHQRVNLGIKCARNVHELIGRLRPEVPNLSGLVGFQALLKVLGKVEVVAGGGVDGVVGGKADRTMIGMKRIGSEGIVGDNHVGAVHSNHPHDLLPKIEIRHQSAILAPQEHHLGHPKAASSFQLLCLTRGGKLVGVDRPIRRSPIP